jgi:hypothetical protein
MKFLLLVHHDESAFAKLPEQIKQEMLDESVQLTHALDAAGHYVHASPLHTANTSTVVRVRDGKALMTDGPFMETKEQLAGYFLIEAGTRAEAIGIAARIPGARIGAVELRQVRDIAGLPHEQR